MSILPTLTQPPKPTPTPPPQPPAPVPPPRRTVPTWPPPQPLPPSVAGPVLRGHPPGASAVDPVLDRLLAERIVFLGGEVDDDAAYRITAQLLLLAADDPDSDVSFYIDCPGGSVTAGIAIYDTMQMIAPDVATWAVGLVASTGQFLLSSGTPGKRYALPHARVLMHPPSPDTGGPAADIAVRAGVFGDLKREIAEITARHTGQSVDTITADADRDRWFTAEQAREYGLVDHVVGTPG